jgi:hypothetical protein
MFKSMHFASNAAAQARAAPAASLGSSRQFSCRVVASSLETAEQRYARAAAKYRTGPLSNTMYTPPKLLFNADMEDFNLKDQVSRGPVQRSGSDS